MVAFTLRVPDEIIQWLRKKSAMETIKQNKRVSMNELALNVFRKEMERDKKKKRG